MRKTGRPIDLKPKNGITFDKSKIECFNCQKLGHFARECKFAKYQANRANGSKEKRIVPIEDSNSKALVAKDSQGEIDWTKEFDDDPVTFAMVALNGIEEDDWSIEIDADHVDIGQDGLGVFDWSEEVDTAPVALALMATSSTDSSSSEVPYCSNCSKSYKKLLNDYQTERDNFQRARADVAFTGINELAIRNKVINKQNSETSGTYHESYWVDSDDEEVPLGVSEIKKQTGLKSETSSENKSPRSKDSFGQRSKRRGLGCRDGKGNPEEELKDHAIIDSGCSRSMTGDKDKLSDFKDYKGGYVAFGNDPKGGRIIGKGTIKTSCIDFENVSYVKELKFNLLSISQICDKKHNVLFTDTECLILSPKFKIVDENLVLLRAPRKNDVYSLNLKSIIPSGGVTCLVARASEDEAILWHRRLGHCELQGIFNKLVKSNLGVERTLGVAHMVLFGLCFSSKLNRKKRNPETEYSIARTPQQNGVAERKNRTLIEAARTMLADSLLPIQFWAEAVHTACYVLNRVLVTKPQMKTPYELLMGKSPNISFMKPFGCPLTILNTLDHLGKFEGKSEEGYLLGYSTNSKGFRVYNRVTRKVQDCLHVDFLENQMNQKGKGPDWMFDLDILTPSLNYIPFIVHGSSSIGNKADSGTITNDAQNKVSDESTVDKEVPLTKEDQVLQKEFENLMLPIANTHMANQGIASEKRKEKGKEIYDLSKFDDDLPKDGIFYGNSFDDENKDIEEEIDLDLNNMDNSIDVSSSSTLRIHKNHPQSQIIGPTASGVKTRK
ncbi:ribonuclease H-like domain-containing protein [Tanacetum coccineum]